MTRDHAPPRFLTDNFHCPFSECGTYSHMEWFRYDQIVWAARCARCQQSSIWRKYPAGENVSAQEAGGALLYPIATEAPPHHPDLPVHIQRDYEEARLICSTSPRAAAALLRLSVQKICNHLLQKEGDINNQIGELVRQGLPAKVQRSLDSLRVIGNESVHPGTMDLNDSPELALALFRLINLIVQSCITDPNEADEIFSSLPPGKLKGIEARDKAKPGDA